MRRIVSSIVRPTVVPIVLVMGCAACGDGEPARGVGLPGAATPKTLPTTLPAPTAAAPATAPPTTAAPTTVDTTPTTTVALTTTLPTTSVVPTTEVPETTAPPEYDPEPVMGTLKAGVEGPRSLQLQRDLIALGFLPEGADDGLYGPGTAGGVRRFQEANDLVADGVFGPNTRAALEAAIAALEAPAPTSTTI